VALFVLAADSRHAILTAIIGLTFAIDGATQIALALTVPTAMLVPDSTAARIVVYGTGLIVTLWYFRTNVRGASDHPPASNTADDHDRIAGIPLREGAGRRSSCAIVPVRRTAIATGRLARGGRASRGC
jgi:hypothetical protein